MKAPCRVDYCTAESDVKGLCPRHYSSKIRNGNPILCDVSIERISPKASECSLEGCPNLTVVGSLCRSHQHRKNRYGDPSFVPNSRSETCSECDERYFSSGLCRRHYRSKMKYGDPLTVDQNKIERLERKSVCRRCSVPLPKDWEKATSGYICDDCLSYQNRRNKALKAYGPAALPVFERIHAGESCEVCGEKTSRMAIDHCHDSKRVRGLLCSNCNTSLGLLKEDPDVIMGLLAYLEHHGT